MKSTKASVRKHVESLLKARTQYVNNPSIEMVPEMVDLNTAIDRARLSRRQAEAITYVHGIGLSQAEAAEALGVGKSNIAKYINEAAGKIAGVYRKWHEADPDSRYTEISYTWEGE